MRNNGHTIALVFAIMAAVSTSANADEANTAQFKFSGFATLGASHSSEDRGDYVVDSTVPKGAGLSNDWAFGNDTRMGVQVSADFTERITAVLQVLSEYQADSTYRPGIDWLNVKYAFSPDFYLRAGRIALPTFLHSGTREVGYSYPWIHPPVELYRQLAITNSDGVDAMYRIHIGDADNIVKAIYGTNKIDRRTSISTSRGMWGIFDEIQFESAILRVGYQERESSSYNTTTGVTGAWTRNSDLSAGASYDLGNWFITSEWIQRQSTTKKQAMYVSAGYHMHKITPYVIYSQDSPSSFLTSATQSARSIQTAKNSQHAVSAGMRWDFMKKADLKLQYDMIKLSANSNGHLANVPNGTILYGDRFHVFSVVADFLF